MPLILSDNILLTSLDLPVMQICLLVAEYFDSSDMKEAVQALQVSFLECAGM